MNKYVHFFSVSRWFESFTRAGVTSELSGCTSDTQWLVHKSYAFNTCAMNEWWIISVIGLSIPKLYEQYNLLHHQTVNSVLYLMNLKWPWDVCVVGRMSAPQRCPHPIPQTCKYITLFYPTWGKKKKTVQMWLRILRGHDPGLPRWAQCNHKVLLLKREAESRENMMETEVWAMWPWSREWAKPLETEKGGDSSLEPPEGTQSLIFSLRRPILDFWLPELYDNLSFVVSKSLSLWSRVTAATRN